MDLIVGTSNLDIPTTYEHWCNMKASSDGEGDWVGGYKLPTLLYVKGRPLEISVHLGLLVNPHRPVYALVIYFPFFLLLSIRHGSAIFTLFAGMQGFVMFQSKTLFLIHPAI